MKRLESFFLVMHTQWVSVVYQVYPMMKVHDMGKIHHGIVAKNVEFFVAKTGCHVYHPPVITIFWLVVWLSFPGKWVVKMTLFYPHTNWISPKKNIRTNKSLEHMKYPLHQSDAICGPQLVEARVPTFLYQGTWNQNTPNFHWIFWGQHIGFS